MEKKTNDNKMAADRTLSAVKTREERKLLRFIEFLNNRGLIVDFDKHDWDHQIYYFLKNKTSDPLFICHNCGEINY